MVEEMKFSREQMRAMMEAHAAQLADWVPELPKPNRNCLSYWFPLLQRAGVPVPETYITKLSLGEFTAFCDVMDCKDVGGRLDGFVGRLAAMGSRVGYPCFLRTGQFSGKHSWEQACYIQCEADFWEHALQLVSESSMIDLDWNVWCVRRLLPTVKQMVADKYGNMPICREFRYFATDGEIHCHHPYWPLHALKDGMSVASDLEEKHQRLSELLPETAREIIPVIRRASLVVPGTWSFDVIETHGGQWYLTDMAVAARSWHPQECPNSFRGEVAGAIEREFDSYHASLDFVRRSVQGERFAYRPDTLGYFARGYRALVAVEASWVPCGVCNGEGWMAAPDLEPCPRCCGAGR